MTYLIGRRLNSVNSSGILPVEKNERRLANEGRCT